MFHVIVNQFAKELVHVLHCASCYVSIIFVLSKKNQKALHYDDDVFRRAWHDSHAVDLSAVNLLHRIFGLLQNWLDLSQFLFCLLCDFLRNTKT